jgi:hypothetical protein
VYFGSEGPQPVYWTKGQLLCCDAREQRRRRHRALAPGVAACGTLRAGLPARQSRPPTLADHNSSADRTSKAVRCSIRPFCERPRFQTQHITRRRNAAGGPLPADTQTGGMYCARCYNRKTAAQQVGARSRGVLGGSTNDCLNAAVAAAVDLQLRNTGLFQTAGADLVTKHAAVNPARTDHGILQRHAPVLLRARPSRKLAHARCSQRDRHDANKGRWAGVARARRGLDLGLPSNGNQVGRVLRSGVKWNGKDG